MRKKRKKRYYALPCMVCIAVIAALLTAGGFILRRTVLADLPQYNDAPDIAIPMMLLQDSGPLREARARAEWEASLEDSAQEPLMLAEAETPEAAPAAAPAAEANEDPQTAEAEIAAPAAEETAATTEAAAEPADGEPVVEAIAMADPASVEADAQIVENPEPPAEQPVIIDEPLPAWDLPADAAPAEDLPAWLDEEPEAAPVQTEVAESYFDHTLFIGDSKTDGLRMWGRLGEAQYFCGTSYSVYNIFDKTASDADFKNAKLDKVLASHKYDQVYIMLGYNECGYPYDSLMKQFRYVITRVHKAQPQARIILHGIMHASARVASKYDYYTVQNIEKANDGLRELAASTDGLYYVDCNEPFCDENGFLLSHVSSDGEHLTPEYTKQWAQEILKRAIVE